MTTDNLPAYSLPLDQERPPGYSSTPLTNERTVAYNPRPCDRYQRHGHFTHSWKQVTLILHDQDENASIPSYSRGSTVNGEIGLSNSENIIEVNIKLYGQMTAMAADCGSMGATLVSDTRMLWNQDEPKERCPSILPFAIKFPQTFKDPSGQSWKLPPSFETNFSGIPAIFCRCVYTLSITVSRTKRYALASWNSSRTSTIVLDYRPRTRPQRPVIMVDSIFASIKPIPEEWQQHIMTLEPRSEDIGQPLDCHFLVPSVQTYSITDPIPFHIQLRGPLESIHELVPPYSRLLSPEQGEGHEQADPIDLGPTGPHGIRVYLARQIHLEINGRKRYRTYTIGTSQMHPIPPVVTWEGESSNSVHDLCLDWQGELKCREDVLSASFCAGMLAVKDFIIVGLAPCNGRSSLLSPIQLAYPIRLVTDSWVDLGSVHPQDL